MDIIRTYDGLVIRPREQEYVSSQAKQHGENQAKFEKLDIAVEGLKEEVKKYVAQLTEMWDTFNSWKGSVKVILWLIVGLLVPTLLGVAALVFDFVKWGIANHWKWS